MLLISSQTASTAIKVAEVASRIISQTLISSRTARKLGTGEPWEEARLRLTNYEMAKVEEEIAPAKTNPYDIAKLKRDLFAAVERSTPRSDNISSPRKVRNSLILSKIAFGNDASVKKNLVRALLFLLLTSWCLN